MLICGCDGQRMQRRAVAVASSGASKKGERGERGCVHSHLLYSHPHGKCSVQYSESASVC
jgi:hypothetical protein